MSALALLSVAEDIAETQLVALACTGHPGAFRVIMQRSNQQLFRVARGILTNEAEAEDAVQEAYMRAFAKLDTFRGEANLLTWLTRITINEARGRLRRRRTTVDLDQLDLAAADGRIVAFPSPRATSPETDFASTQMRQIIEHAIDQLPEAFRLVFVMRDVHECSIEETATALGLKPETVKTRLHRARRLLRGALNTRLAGAIQEAFPFLGDRCEQITSRVLDRLEAQQPGHDPEAPADPTR